MIPDKLFIAFVIFGIVDLCFVGTTMLAVVILVIKILNDRNLLEEIKKLLESRKKDTRNFIEKGK